MDDVIQLAGFIYERNQTERNITKLINRPAAIGHIGEYVASKIFHIKLEESANHKGSDGYFQDGVLNGCSVNIKWYAMHEGMLDINPSGLPDYYLVLAGPKPKSKPKPKQLTPLDRVRPWLVDFVFLFRASDLVVRLEEAGVKFGSAASVAKQHWEEAEIYPKQTSQILILAEEQRKMLASFSDKTKGVFGPV